MSPSSPQMAFCLTMGLIVCRQFFYKSRRSAPKNVQENQINQHFGRGGHIMFSGLIVLCSVMDNAGSRGLKKRNYFKVRTVN